ncbi:MAG: DUF2794 domain-containing protein [Proteobacteria bacterium]|jgi:hypothetical protein|nr:DUF2794 domain-containing protein [Pseudomonadota bacterium]|tara:strand:- start:10 stop:405 length:396 start_codon:yes stop_codon:yes gene_type:complete
MQILNFTKRSNYFLNKDNISKNINNKKKSDKNIIYFSKTELTLILNLYSKQVSSGLWKDYAIDSKYDIAVFSIYRHTHDQALYQIIKISNKGNRENPNFLIKNHNKVLDKSRIFPQMLSIFEKKIELRKYN